MIVMSAEDYDLHARCEEGRSDSNWLEFYHDTAKSHLWHPNENTNFLSPWHDAKLRRAINRNLK